MQQQRQLNNQKATTAKTATKKETFQYVSQKNLLQLAVIGSNMKDLDKILQRAVFGKKIMIVCDFSRSIGRELSGIIKSFSYFIAKTNPYLTGAVVKGAIARNVVLPIKDISDFHEVFVCRSSDIERIIEQNCGGVRPDYIFVMTDEEPNVLAGKTTAMNLQGTFRDKIVWWNLSGTGDAENLTGVWSYYSGITPETIDELSKELQIAIGG